MAETVPPLLADAMLGKLARWLRLIGYDTRYARGDDAFVAHCARAEGRVVLTRDHELARRRGLDTLLITSQDLETQIAQVVAAFGRPAEARPRCMHCNAPLVVISRAEARAYVPPYVAENHTLFHRCPECGKIYWRGTHWHGIERQLLQGHKRSDRTPPTTVQEV